MSEISFTEEGFSDYVYWQGQDRKTLKRINELLKSIDRDGALNGIGKPELLRYKAGEYSRRIDEKNRLIYEVEVGKITVKSCKDHYES